MLTIEQLRTEITEQVQLCTDADLLDLVYKLLAAEG